MSGVIPKEKLANYQRWQIGSFDQKPTVTSPPPQPAPATSAVPQESAPAEPGPPSAEEIARIHEEARASGYEAGLEEGREAGERAGQEAAQEEAERIRALIGNIETALGELDQTLADNVLKLALEVAAQLTQGAIKANTEVLLPVIREAISNLPLHHAQITLRLNPADAANVRKHLGEQLTQGGSQIIEDAEITPGGCQVRAGSSEVDATIETRWRRVLEAIGAEPTEWLNRP